MKKTRQQYLTRGLILIFIGIIMLIIFYYQRSTEHQTNMFYLDTYISVKIYTHDKKKATEALQEVDRIYQQYHQLADSYQAYDNINNIYYFNEVALVNEKVKIEPELYHLIQYGLDAYKQTNGLVNIALGNVIDIWHTYRDNADGIPTKEELQKAGSTNINNLILHKNYLMEKTTDIKLDLGSITKGYATQVVGDYLTNLGIDKYLINAGGNVKVGNHYQKNRYKIGLKEPKPNSNNIFKVINANNISVVTSGSYERFYQYDGKIYHHIIDPLTLFPPNYFYAVTVITPNNALADVLSTALFLMDLESGQAFIKSFNNVDVIWYDINNKIHYSAGIKNYE
ncbi:MAG: FAD:protein FMN transferase [Bacilli bacterium]|jgi:thiamine biosynthesis lipoprotein|nr:FAD:protein FMN transferase [Bacilli bacterium]